MTLHTLIYGFKNEGMAFFVPIKYFLYCKQLAGKI